MPDVKLNYPTTKGKVYSDRGFSIVGTQTEDIYDRIAECIFWCGYRKEIHPVELQRSREQTSSFSHINDDVG